MIVVRLQGGLGNQMFQYAMGRALAIKNNVSLGLDTTFLLDRTPIPNFTFRDYNLGDFNIQATIVSKKDIPFLYRKYPIGIFMRYIDYIRRKLLSTRGKEKMAYSFDSKMLNSGPNIYLEGWWQSYKYFIDYENIIKKDFTLKNPSDKIKKIIEEIKSKNSVCVQIRRGDYINNNFHNVLTKDYYTKALEIISKKEKIDCIYVFDRDNIQWCKENIKFDYPIMYIENDISMAECVTLMSSCKHFVMANSSLSWWAGWLSSNQNKIVVTPKKWVTNSDIDTKDLIPESWIRI